uniref:Uncharacterized protein n=1 Tax=Anopheles albimanus TaxID=7167 RepID=A0A182FZG9_ANOAL
MRTAAPSNYRTVGAPGVGFGVQFGAEDCHRKAPTCCTNVLERTDSWLICWPYT